PIGHPIRPHSRPRGQPPRGLHHFVGYPTKEEGIGLRDVLGVVTMHFFVRGYCTMIAAPVQGDVDGIPKGSHCILGLLAGVLGWHGQVPPCRRVLIPPRPCSTARVWYGR